jgi:[ribosomal protein S18]-alanine N-acetyltransferase
MIRLATEADLARVAALESELFGPDAWDDVALRGELDGPGRRFVVAVADEVIGYAVSRSIGDVVDLQRIGVSREQQRAGTATALLHDLLAHPGDADRMMLEVSAANEAAIAFYLRAGFTPIAERPRYYRDGSDALVMNLPLDAALRASGRMDG